MAQDKKLNPSQIYINSTHLVQEVPGVPEHERWYLWRHRKVEQHFSTEKEGVEYCKRHSIEDYNIDYFEY